jgi:hypothetical protein
MRSINILLTKLTPPSILSPTTPFIRKRNPGEHTSVAWRAYENIYTTFPTSDIYKEPHTNISTDTRNIKNLFIDARIEQTENVQMQNPQALKSLELYAVLANIYECLLCIVRKMGRIDILSYFADSTIKYSRRYCDVDYSSRKAASFLLPRPKIWPHKLLQFPLKVAY